MDRPHTDAFLDGVLEELRGARDELEAAQDAVDRFARHAHRHGASWTEVGEVLGISRQAAWQRFGKEEQEP